MFQNTVNGKSMTDKNSLPLPAYTDRIFIVRRKTDNKTEGENHGYNNRSHHLRDSIGDHR